MTDLQTPAPVRWTDTHRWYESSANLAELASYLADEGYSAQDVAHAMGYPWKYESEWVKLHGQNPDRLGGWSDVQLAELGAV